MIKRLLLFLCLSAGAWAQSTTTVTGTIKNLGTGNVSSGTFVRFWLRGCAGNLPRINGTGIIAPTLGNVFYFDMVPNSSGVISGTLYSTRDSTGLLGGAIECGGSTTAVWYGFQPYLNGKAGPETPIAAKASATIDISNITPLTTNPVVTAPTGDSTYLRLDAGNGPLSAALAGPFNVTGAGSFTGALSTQSTFTSQALEGCLVVGTATGQYASLALAQAALPGTGGCIFVSPGWSETWSAGFACASNTTILFLGPATITMSTNAFTMPTGGSNVGGCVVRGLGNFYQAVSSGSQKGVTFVYTGSGSAFSFGDSSAQSTKNGLENIGIDITGAGTSAGCITLTNSSQNVIKNVQCQGASGGTSQFGMNLVTSGSSVITSDNLVDGFHGGSLCNGLKTSTTALNPAQKNIFHNLQFSGTQSGCTSLLLGVGFTGNLLDADISAAHLAVNFNNNGGNQLWLYNDANTQDVTFTGTAANNVVWLTAETNNGSMTDVVGQSNAVFFGARLLEYNGQNVGGFFPVYSTTGGQFANPHSVIGVCTLGTNCNVTFTNGAVFTSSSTYACQANDTTSAAAVKVAISSGTAVTFTGTGTDAVIFTCIGD